MLTEMFPKMHRKIYRYNQRYENVCCCYGNNDRIFRDQPTLASIFFDPRQTIIHSFQTKSMGYPDANGTETTNKFTTIILDFF